MVDGFEASFARTTGTVSLLVLFTLGPLTVAGPAAAENAPEGRSEPIDLTATGSLPKESIDTEIRMHLREIQACYQRELNRQPNLEGKVVVRFEISPEGSVAWVEVAGTDMKETPVPSCVSEVIGGLEFPEPAGGGVVRVTYPFRFRSIAGHTAPDSDSGDYGPPAPSDPGTREAEGPDAGTVRMLRRAHKALALGRAERAETLFHRAWAGDPNCGSCARGLASALMAQDRHDAALRVLTERVTWFSQDAWTWALRASCAFTLEEHEEARTSLDVYFDLLGGMPATVPSVTDGSTEGGVLETLLWCTTMYGAAGLYTDYLLDDGDPRDAANALELTREHCGDDPALDALDAWVLGASGKPREAAARLEGLLETHPGDPFVAATVDEFVDEYAPFATPGLLDAADPYARARGDLGLAALRQKFGDPLGCLEHAERAAQTDDPDLLRAVNRLGLDCALATEDMAQVTVWIEQSGGPDGIAGILLVPTGLMLLEHDLAEDALALSRAERESIPPFHKAQMRGLELESLRTLGRLDEALELALATEDPYPHILAMLAVTLGRAGRADDASALMARACPGGAHGEVETCQREAMDLAAEALDQTMPIEETEEAAPAPGSWTLPPPEGVRWTQVEVTWAMGAALGDDGQVVAWNDEGGDPDWWEWTKGAAVTQLTMSMHGCAVDADRTVRCDRCLPLMDAGACDVPEGEFTLVTAGAMHSCGLRTEGTVACWGCGTYGEEGALSTDRGQCSAPEGRFIDLSAGQDHTCGLRDDGTVVCWGCGEQGGPQDHGQCDAPAGTFVAVEAAYQHTCALADDGRVACWGCIDAFDPAACSPPDTRFTSLVDSDEQACALTEDGEVVCWSGTYFHLPSTSLLGYPLPAHEEIADGVAPPPGPYEQVSLDVDGGCGIRTDGVLVCWGREMGSAPPAP